MSADLTTIENAAIDKVNAVQVLVTPAVVGPPAVPAVYRPFFAKVDVYQGERGEEFLNLSRQYAPSVWFRTEHALNQPGEFTQAMTLGQSVMTGTTQNRESITLGLFCLAKSLRSPRELRQGGLGVVGLYDILNLIIGPKNSPATTAGQLRGYKPAGADEPFVFVGWELLGQSTTAVAAQLLFRTRVQL